MKTPLRYRPKAVIYRPDPPAHYGLLYNMLTSEMVHQSTTVDGRDNISWITLRPEDKIQDAGMPGNESSYSNFHLPTLYLNGLKIWKNSYPGSWIYQPSPKEKTWRRLALDTYQTDLNELAQKPNPTEADLEEMANLRALIDNLNEGGQGYLSYGFNMLESGSMGITWGLQAANIPVKVTSAFTTQKNRSQNFRLKLLEAPKGQVNREFTIEIGNGNSLYAIVIGDDGNASKFKHYRNMSEAKRFKLIEELNKVLDTGRLTVENMITINNWETEINAIRYKSKQDSDKRLTEDEHLTLTELQDKIEALKDSKKGLTEQNNDKKKALEDMLYLSEEDFNLAESSKSLIGTIIDFSVIFLRSGYVLIQSKDGRKIYENKRLTGGVPKGAKPTYGDGLPDKAYITIKSNGGMWSMVYGNNRYDNKGIVKSELLAVDFDFTEDDVTWMYAGDANNEGCAIEFELKLIKPKEIVNGIYHPAIYQIIVTLRSDVDVSEDKKGRHSPELHFLELYIKPAIPSNTSTILWNSEDPSEMWHGLGKNKIRDLLFRDERDKSRVCKLVITDNTTKGLPKLLGGAACDIVLHDEHDDVDLSVAKHGFIVNSDRGEVKDITKDGFKLKIPPVSGNEIEFEISGCEYFFNKEIKNKICGNDIYVGDYLRLLSRDAGVQPSLYENLPVGNQDGCPKIKILRPGHYPDCKPAENVTYWEWMRNVVKKHAPKWKLWTDEYGLRLTRKEIRVRNDLQYSTSEDIKSPLRPVRDSTSRSGLKLRQDLRRYYTSALIIGGMDPSTGTRYTGFEIIPQATDERFSESMFYVNGVENRYTSEKEDDLTSTAECNAVARDKLNITPATPMGLTPWEMDEKILYDPTVRVDEVVFFNGIRFLRENVEFSALNTGSTPGQFMFTTEILAQDLEVVESG